GASGSEGFQQNPSAYQLHGRGLARLRRGQRSHGQRMSARHDHLINSNHNYNRQSPNKQICGSNERRSRFLHAAQIDYRQDRQYEQTQSQGVRQQRRNGGDQGSDAGGDSYGYVEKVIDHQGRARQQARAFAEVLVRYGVGSAAIGIGGDGLAIAEKNDDQQSDHGKGQRDNVLDSDQPQRQQNGQGGFRAVGRRTQGIQTKRGNALSWSNPFSFVLGGGERTAEQNVDQSHIDSPRKKVSAATIPKLRAAGDPPRLRVPMMRKLRYSQRWHPGLLFACLRLGARRPPDSHRDGGATMPRRNSCGSSRQRFDF